MLNTQYDPFKLKYNYFLALCSMCLSLSIVAPALAKYQKPPSTSNDAPNSQATGVAAIRGICSQNANGTEEKADFGSLTTLAPYGHVGYSASTNPTFTWYVPDSKPYPIEFALYEFDPSRNKGKGNEVYKAELKNFSGIMTHSLSTEQIDLTPGKEYIWQVAVICDRNSPAKTLIVRNQVKIVEIDPTIATKLNSNSDSQSSNETDSVTRANIYAEAGLWYDAIAEVATLQNDPQARKAMVDLISQLAAIEQQDDSNLEIENTETHQQKMEKVIEVLLSK